MATLVPVIMETIMKLYIITIFLMVMWRKTDKYLNVLSSYGAFNARVNPNGYAYQYYIWAGVESTFMGETTLFELIKNPGDEVFETYPSYYYEGGVQYPAFSTLQAAYISQDIAPVIIIE